MIKILIVDDSITETLILKNMFQSQPDMQVVACAHNGKQAIELTARLNPDLITMDLEMPEMDGHTATRLIMSQHPTPIVVISSKLNSSEADMTYLALEAGAVSVLEKPDNTNEKSYKLSTKYIIDTVRSMAEIKVIKRRFNTHLSKGDNSFSSQVKHQKGKFELVAIGSSVGGPQALKTILSDLPNDLSVPIVIVQHMTKGFMSGFTSWLNNNISLPVKEVEDNELLKNGTVYLAPDNYHFIVDRTNNNLIARLKAGDKISGFCPSISALLQSTAKTCGYNSMGILLTGMGSDGAQGLADIKNAGGHTITQDKKSCIVYGMAGVAHAMNAVDKIVDLDQIAEYIIQATTKNGN